MPQQTFQTIVIRPHWKYHILRIGWLMVLSVVTFFIGGLENMRYQELWFVLSAVTSLAALYECYYLSRLVVKITNEQLMIQKGIALRTCDYIELYRVIDFVELRNIPQQILGLKTIILYTTDCNNPRITLVGIPNNMDLVSIIRHRVLHNRKLRNIHEFSNII